MTLGPLAPLLPELIVLGTACLLLVLELLLYSGAKGFGGIAAAGMAAALWVALGLPEGSGTVLFDGMVALDPLAHFFRCLTLLGGIVTVLLTRGYEGVPSSRRAAFHAMLLFATLAMMLMASANTLLMMVLSIEFLGLTSFVLVGFVRRDVRSAEAALKYFLIGAFSSALMLYGMSLIYGLAGTTALPGLLEWYRHWSAPASQFGSMAVFLVAALLILAGFGFKVAMVPFHMWVPDVYDGAPTPMTAFLAIASKAAGFAVLLRVFLAGLPALPELTAVVAWLAAITMTLGNVLALQQQNMKRLLAYSSIGHAGYVLVGVVASSQLLGVRALAAGPGTEALHPDVGLQGVMVYLLAYLFMNAGAFAGVIALSNRHEGRDDLKSYAGLSQASPGLAAAMVFFLLSLAGLPPTAGFVGKFYIFRAALEHDFVWLAVVGGLNSVIAVAVYFRVAYQMYFVPAPAEAGAPLAVPFPLKLVLIGSVAGVAALGLFPNALLEIVKLPLLWA